MSMMNVSGIDLSDTVNRYRGIATNSPDKSESTSFETVFQSAMNLIKETDELTNKAEEEEIKFAMGQSDSIHDLQVAQQKAGILKYGQHRQQQRRAQHQRALFGAGVLFDSPREKPAQGGIQQKQRHIPRPRPAEKDQREGQHGNIFGAHTTQPRLGDQVQRQKQKDKQQAGKYHLAPSPNRKKDRRFPVSSCRKRGPESGFSITLRALR